MSAYQYIEMPVDGDGVVSIRVNKDVNMANEEGFEPMGSQVDRVIDAVVTRAPDAFDQFMAQINTFATGIWNHLPEREDLRPDEISIEFGMSIDGKAKFAVVDFGGEAQFKIALKWDLKKRGA